MEDIYKKKIKMKTVCLYSNHCESEADKKIYNWKKTVEVT